MKNGGNSQWILCKLKSIPGESGETRSEEIKSRVHKEEDVADTPANPQNNRYTGPRTGTV